MSPVDSPSSFLERVGRHPTLASMVAHHHRLEGSEPTFGETERPLPPPLAEALRQRGIERLYRHQAQGIDLARRGRDVLAVTPTASGKTLLFALSVLSTIHEDRNARALFVYPTKALAQDQLGGLRDLAGAFGALDPPRFEIYDGDTPPTRRRRIKADPPEVLITNPDMLHLGILARHADWQRFLSGLRWIVLDELHVYRGIFGSHVHHILARLCRLAESYGAKPRFIAASATIGNPQTFARDLAGRPFDVVSASGAARAPLDVVFLNPVGVSPYTAAVRVLGETARAGLRTIAFTKARRITELLHNWLLRQEPGLRGRVEPSRAGYLPAERRALEGRLFRGELDAVITTSALELGIDVGALDACVLVGYPGSLTSSWQRIGRVGRQQREGLVVLIAMPDALDQYVVHHPELFFGGEFENAVLDPWNPLVAGQHLVCAASEQPIVSDEVDRFAPAGRGLVDTLTGEGRLVQDAAGSSWYSLRRRPHRDVSPRSAGQPYLIVERVGAGNGREPRERILGRIDGVRVWYECHPGAVYLHAGRSYVGHAIDADRRRVAVERAHVDHYTSVLGEKQTAILERTGHRSVGPFHVGIGRVEVTVQIRGYQKRRLFGGEPLSTHPLDAPPLVYETLGFWIELPAAMPAAFAERGLHFMGGIHATEHALIGLFPLLAIADRGDVGGISYTGHPQLGCPAVFVYDGVPGGAGLAEQAAAGLDTLVARTRERLAECPCEDGCPGCIQSPMCGNGNKPLDKRAARLVLDLLHGAERLDSLGLEPQQERSAGRLRPFTPASAPLDGQRRGIVRAGNVEPPGAVADAVSPAVIASRPPDAEDAHVAGTDRVMVLDVETQRSADEVGGWGHTDKMGLALAVVFDAHRNVYRTYYEADVHRLLLDLVMADRVVGFNIDRFDLAVLSGYSEWDLTRIRTLDLLSEIRSTLGFRISLNHLSEANLGEGKAGDGLQSLRWWRDGRLDLIEQYCRKDVDATRRLFELGRRQRYLLYRDQEQRMVRVPVRW